MTPEQIREIAMEALASRLAKNAGPSSCTTLFAVSTKELLEIIERLEPPVKDCPPTPTWRSMDTVPKDGRWILVCHLSAPRPFHVVRWADGRWMTVTDGVHGEGCLIGWSPVPGEDGPQ